MNLSLKQLNNILANRAFAETDPARREAMLAIQNLITTKYSNVKGRIDFDAPTEEEDDPMDDFNYVGSRHHY